MKEENPILLKLLRNRLFDFTRRNRLLFFKPDLRFLHLTAASLNTQNSSSLLLDNSRFLNPLLKAKQVSLNSFLPLHIHPYINSVLNKLISDSKKDLNEFGFSSLKLACCFLKWFNLKENPYEEIISPLLLIPVVIQKIKGIDDDYQIQFVEDDIEVNPVLAHKFKELFNINLPHQIAPDLKSIHQFIDSLSLQISESVKSEMLTPNESYINQLISIVSRNNKHEQNAVGQAFFSHSPAKEACPFCIPFPESVSVPYHPRFFESLACQYPHFFFLLPYDNAELVVSESCNNWVFDNLSLVLGSFNSKKLSLVNDYSELIDANLDFEARDALFADLKIDFELPIDSKKNPPIVVDADPTQIKAVQYAACNKHYIIQGPPGTGKSQTITNLIAAALTEQKRVLFICEKRAAIDVVYRRLQSVNLDVCTALIHDSQADKKSFIQNLKHTYEFYRNEKLNLEYLTAQIKRLNLEYQHAFSQIHEWHTQMQKTTEYSSVPLFELWQLKTHSKSITPAVVYYSQWIQFKNSLIQFDDALKRSQCSTSWSSHPFRFLNRWIFDSSFTFARFKKELLEVSDLLKLKLNEAQLYKEQNIFLKDWDSAISALELMLPLLSKNLHSFFLPSSHSENWMLDFENYKSVNTRLHSKKQENINWKNKFSYSDLTRSIEIWELRSNSWLRFLYSDFRSFCKQLKNSYDFSNHQIKPSPAFLLDNLKQEYELENLCTKEYRLLQKGINGFDPEDFYNVIQKVGKISHPLIIKILVDKWEESKVVELIQQFHRLKTLSRLFISNADSYTLNELSEIIHELHSVEDEFLLFQPIMEKLAEAPVVVFDFLKKHPGSAADLQYAAAAYTLDDFLLQNPGLSKIDISKIESAAEDLAYLSASIKKCNAEYIVALQQKKCTDFIFETERSIAGLTEQQKEKRNDYLEARKTLEHEFGKSTRYKSIRELASEEASILVSLLKPVWMMSPLSVSDTLPLKQMFDIVIYDEASQLTLEEALLPAFRAKQMIVVGDEQQMPPASYFQVMPEVEPMQNLSQRNVEKLKSPSFLNRAAQVFPSVLLGWHYRSRHQSLMAFSNAAFYRNQLLTFPDILDSSEPKNPIVINEIKQDEVAVDWMNQRPLSYHFVSKGRFVERTNVAEAQYIAFLLFELLKKYSDLSIGVVAFSVEQQLKLEKEVNAFAQKNAEFERLLREAESREDDGQWNGLFFKNLENVQGDERDIIIISTAYGYNNRGKMLMNFGPINRKGGEKRLNVLFSRAKKRVVLVTSIKASDITNLHNEGARLFHSYLQMAESYCVSNTEKAFSTLQKLCQDVVFSPISPALVSLQNLLLLKLRELGWVAVIPKQNGKLTPFIAIKDSADAPCFSTGIFVDDENHYHNTSAEEAWLARSLALKSYGWNVVRLLLKDWDEHPDEAFQILIKHCRMERPQKVYQKEVDLSEQLQQHKFLMNTYSLVHTETQRFCNLTIEGLLLIIESGKINGTSRRIIKNYEDLMQLENGKNKWIRDKQKEGFVMVPPA